MPGTYKFPFSEEMIVGQKTKMMSQVLITHFHEINMPGTYLQVPLVKRNDSGAEDEDDVPSADHIFRTTNMPGI